MQSGVPAAAESHCWSQGPGLGGLSMSFTLAFCALFPDFAKAFPIQLHPRPSHQFSDRGEKGEEAKGKQRAQTEDREQGRKPTGLGW